MEDNIQKGTHDEYKTELFMPIMKGCKGKYMAVLSDNSMDRDEESLSKGCIEKLGQDNGYVAALCNHNNDVFMQVAEWVNRGVKEIDGHLALIAEPKFFMSNPNAKIIKGMLDDGAKIGISIGAMVKTYDEDTQGNRIFTELELLEASFVAIPSNRHGRAMAVAKSFSHDKNKKIKEASTMEKEFTQKDLDSAIDKKVEEMKLNMSKQKTELEEVTKKLETKDSELKELQKSMETKQKLFDEEKVKLSEEVEKAKKVAIEKQQHANQGGDKEPSEEDVEKSLEKGFLPVGKRI